jgi:hypothetical protein
MRRIRPLKIQINTKLYLDRNLDNVDINDVDIKHGK